MLEKKTQSKLEDDIKKSGGYVIRQVAGASRSRGLPDLTACVGGSFYAFEVKREKGDRETIYAQIDQLRQIARSGGFAYYWCQDSLNLPKAFRDIFYESPKSMNDKQKLLKTVKDLLAEASVIRVYEDKFRVYYSEDN